MSSSIGELTYPDGDHPFNHIDTFVTSWQTPPFSQQPSYLSFWYQTNQHALDPWIRVFNSSAPLNGSKSVSLDSLADGTGIMNLDYMDPDRGFLRVFGTIFTVVTDPVTRSATTWCAGPVTTTTNYPQRVSSTALPTMSTAMTTVQTASAPVSALPSSTSQPSDLGRASASSQGVISSIVLGSALAFLIIAFVIGFWFRKWRKQGNHASNKRSKPSNELQPYWSSFTSGKNAHPTPTELSNSDRRPELPQTSRAELSTTRWTHGPTIAQ